MLYSIIPPILVVLSLVGIIVFLVKKAPQVSNLGAEERINPSAIDLREPGFFSRSAKKIKDADWKAGKNIFLLVFEKIAKLFRLIFSKLGAVLSFGWTKIKNRKKRKQLEEETAEKEKTMTEDEVVIAKVREYMPEKKIVIKKSIEPDRPRERHVEPMISKEVVKPRVEIRDRLEELLVERIAANPRDIEAYERLGQYYMEIENYEYAKECYKQVVKLNPLDRNSKFTLRKLERLLSN